jgi:hypothetical protein
VRQRAIPIVAYSEYPFIGLEADLRLESSISYSRIEALNYRDGDLTFRSRWLNKAIETSTFSSSSVKIDQRTCRLGVINYRYL